jgi:hypothetical protein
MAALSADLVLNYQGAQPTKIPVPMISALTFYKGALVFADGASGKAQILPASGDVFLGICAEQVVGTAADEIVEIYVDGVWLLPYTTPANGDEGGMCKVDMGGTLSDNIADCNGPATAAAAGDIAIGVILAVGTSFESTVGWVKLMPGFVFDPVAGSGWSTT